MLSVGRKVLRGESEILGEIFVPVPLCPPRAPVQLDWGRTWNSVVEAADQMPNHGSSYARFVIFKRVLMTIKY